MVMQPWADGREGEETDTRHLGHTSGVAASSCTSSSLPHLQRQRAVHGHERTRMRQQHPELSLRQEG